MTYYLVGIKGSGMSSLAQILHDLGYKVLGSDVSTSFFTEKGLRERGIQILPFNKINLKKDYTYILGNAFNNENEEISTIIKKGYNYYHYSEFLNTLIQKFNSIGISGTHGKTTTTGILTHILSSKNQVNSLIGDGTGQGNINNNNFVFEACEYKENFLNYFPDYIVINNIDFDHPDYFSDIQHVVNAFNKFANQAKKYVIINGDNQYTKELKLNNQQKKLVSFGLGEYNDVFGTNVNYTKDGTTFDLYYNKNLLEQDVFIPLFGEHNVYNALAAITTSLLNGIDSGKIKKNLKTYKGVKRRFNIEEINGYYIVNDYAHHPKEITATVQAAKQRFPNKKIVSIFQPHTYSRLEKFSIEFLNSLSKSDEFYICDVFPSARERGHTYTNKAFFDEKLTKNKKIDINNIANLKKHHNSVLLFLGAGDIDKYIDAFKSLLISKQ